MQFPQSSRKVSARKIRSLVWAVALVPLLTTYLLVFAQGTYNEEELSPERIQVDAKGSIITPQAVIPNTGGAVKRVLASTQDQPLFTTSTSFSAIPGASKSVVVPAGTTDLAIVTFSAECQLINASGAQDWVWLEIRDNGVPMEPTRDPTASSPIAFCSDQGWSMNSIQAVKKLGAGTHNIQVYWKVATGYHKGRLDDWALVVLQSE